MYPPAPRLERSALEDYVLGDSGIRVPKGCVVGVPVYAMHYDPEFFPNPEKFDPDSVQFVPTEKTDVPLKFAIGLGILNTKNITVGIRERPER
ncbi:hypothetical protein HPB52_020340 [Rhipicephalus sanguineus]|uniref:Cytochrome P450 n=1 Tax=Rhipicephalus sanguineus TaxID=34632 RepID=A0A9D4PUY8_RHISA|nr:hypothetical protein HPB52_020340 [Rhipicephalus sanguineus]